MPIYEYQCEKCHHHLEALQKIADKPLRECPECGKHSLKRLVSAPLFRLAGSGWYETDFKSDKEARRNLAGKDEAPTEGSKADDKTGSAPEKAGSSDKPEKVEKPEKSDTSEKPETSERRTIVTSPVATRSAAKGSAKSATKKPAAKKSTKKR